jgi:serine protease AprX
VVSHAALVCIARPRQRAIAPLALLVAAVGVVPASHAVAGMPRVAAIVEARTVDAARHAVEAVGGAVDLALPIVSAVSAHLSADALAALEGNAAVHVVPDVVLHPTSASFDASVVDTQVSALDPGPDWSSDAGRGVGVALVDTGVADTPDLGGRLVRGADFSDEHDGIDHYGHGTFMAGLIAGDGTASAGNSPRHVGIAPGATIVSVKVAGADGSTTLSRVIAGIGWVITHADAYNIGVLNLSFGVEDAMPYIVNPLSAATEAAWSSGITVVASAGNEGSDGVTSPGSDPYVVTVGATDTMGTPRTADDVVTSWSGREQFHTYAKPDVVAPGVSVISLRAPGSTVDTMHPEGRVDANYFRGTGTSMSTALVAGTAAVLLEHHPDATPDDVKGALVDGANIIAGGARAVDLDGADNATARPAWWQRYPVAFEGLDRGLHNGMQWTASRWTASRWTASRWTASRWTASRWTASRWTASRWTASRWTASRWTADEWAASRWTATRWSATRWSATRWSSVAWPSQGWG